MKQLFIALVGWLVISSVVLVYVQTYFAVLFVGGMFVLIFWFWATVYVTSKNMVFVQRGDELLIKNTSRLPLVNGVIRLRYEHLFTHTKFEETHSITVPKRKEIIIRLTPSSCSGEYSIVLAAFSVTDSIKLFRENRPLNLVTNLIVYPERTTMKFLSGNNLATSFKEGIYDSSGVQEIKDIQLYKPGDSVKRIHWKLVAKFDELYVRQMEDSVEKAYALAVDLQAVLNNIMMYDKLIKHIQSLLLEAIAKGLVIDWYYFDKQIAQQKVYDTATVQQVIHHILLNSESYVLSTEEYAALKSRNVIVLTADGGKIYEYN